MTKDLISYQDFKKYQKAGIRTTLRLPCGHGRVELTKAEDQYVTCPTCFKKWFLTWSQIEKNRKLDSPDGK